MGAERIHSKACVTRVRPSPNGPLYSLTASAGDGSLVTKTSLASKEDVDIAVDAATHALQSSWGLKVPAEERAKLMFQLADHVEKNAEELAALEAVNAGHDSLNIISEAKTHA